MSQERQLEGGYRNDAEKLVPQRLAEAFRVSVDTTEEKLDSFAKYVRHQSITKLMAQYELVKKIVDVEGSIIECGVYRGASLFGWLHLSSILDPLNWRRKIYGFDTFAGFRSLSDKDRGCEEVSLEEGCYSSDSQREIEALLQIHDTNRVLGHIEKVALIRGDATATIPEFVASNPHLVVSLLFLDFDLYEPTKVALECFFPRMPKGSVLVLDELNHPLWPGETLAVVETMGIGSLRVHRFPFYPNMSFAIIE